MPPAAAAMPMPIFAPMLSTDSDEELELVEEGGKAEDMFAGELVSVLDVELEVKVELLRVLPAEEPELDKIEDEAAVIVADVQPVRGVKLIPVAPGSCATSSSVEPAESATVRDVSGQLHGAPYRTVWLPKLDSSHAIH